MSQEIGLTLKVKDSNKETGSTLDLIYDSFKISMKGPDGEDITFDSGAKKSDVPFADLLAQPSLQLLIQDALGNPTSVGSPMVPCEVTVGASAASLQQHGYLVPRPPAPRSFPRHLFFMTRGTRGDVQPFVALAKGLANAHGWLVTICTELYWREFVLSEVAELRAGAVHFLPSGGDTHAVTGQWVHQQVMKMQLDAVQQFINGAAEWGFFNSVPVFVHQLKRLQASAQPVKVGV
jgi:hypothetical protein